VVVAGVVLFVPVLLLLLFVVGFVVVFAPGAGALCVSAEGAEADGVVGVELVEVPSVARRQPPCGSVIAPCEPLVSSTAGRRR
jgi:hypothetical protein